MSGPDENKPDNFFSRDWRERLDTVVELMKDISHHTDPLQVGNTYGKRMSNLFPASRRISMSRRDLDKPAFRITRDSTWTEQIDPWREKHRLPMISGGLLAELIYGNEPRVIDNLQPDPDDPGYEYLRGQRSLLAVPMYDHGESLNMVVTIT